MKLGVRCSVQNCRMWGSLSTTGITTAYRQRVHMLPHRACLQPRPDVVDHSHYESDAYQDIVQRPTAAEMYTRTCSRLHVCTPGIHQVYTHNYMYTPIQQAMSLLIDYDNVINIHFVFVVFHFMDSTLMCYD